MLGMNISRISVFFIILLAVSLSALAYEDWIIEGDKVYVNDSKVYLSASPHTTTGGQINLELISKVYTGDINLIFGFDRDILYPKDLQVYSPYNVSALKSYTCEYEAGYIPAIKYAWCYYTVESNETNGTAAYNVTVFEHIYDYGDLNTKTIYWTEITQVDYRDFAIDTTAVDYDYGGVNRWIVGKNLPIIEDRQYKARINLDIGIELNTSGKYWICVMPSSYNLDVRSANEAGHLYCLDPWWNASYMYKYEINDTLIDNLIPFVVNGTYGITIGGKKQIVWTKGDADFYFNNYSDYALTDGSIIIPSEVEKGNESTSNQNFYNYNLSTRAILHLSNLSNSFGGAAVTNNGATLTSAGKIGSAYNFDGTNDEIILPTMSDIRTVMMWFKSDDDISSSSSIGALFGKDGSQYILYTGILTSAIANEVFTFQTVANKYMYWNSTQVGTLSAGVWYHLAITFPTTTSAKLYINGAYRGTAKTYGASPTVPSTWTTPAIGSRNTGVYFDGIIDEVQFYSISFSDSLVNQTVRNHIGITGYGTIGSVEEKPTPNDTCTYSGSGDWAINISDNCVLSSDTDLYPNTFSVFGDDGTLTINASISAKEIHKTPADFDGGFIIRIMSGASLAAVKS